MLVAKLQNKRPDLRRERSPALVSTCSRPGGWFILAESCAMVMDSRIPGNGCGVSSECCAMRKGPLLRDRTVLPVGSRICCAVGLPSRTDAAGYLPVFHSGNNHTCLSGRSPSGQIQEEGLRRLESFHSCARIPRAS
jgi:hypothetical protein